MSEREREKERERKKEREQRTKKKKIGKIWMVSFNVWLRHKNNVNKTHLLVIWRWVRRSRSDANTTSVGRLVGWCVDMLVAFLIQQQLLKLHFGKGLTD